VKLFGAVTVACGALSLSSIANAQVANSQTDGRDYEALAYLPKDTLVALTYFREVSTSAEQSFSQSEGIFRASYILKYGDLSIVPFDALLPVVDATVYVPVPMQGTATLHTSGVGDLTYLPTIGYTIHENDETHTHTVLAGTVYVSGPTGSYDASNPVNIGDHRWRIQPQIGVSQRFLKAITFDLVGSLAFYTANSEFFTPEGYVTMHQNQTFGLEAHLTADLSPDMYLGTSYYVAAVGQRNVESPPVLPLSEYEPEQTTQTLRFTLGIRAEKATLILLQYNQDIEETGGATIGRFIGARLSHAIFF
jgi:Putative MetA-pathway of phenol degradation